MTGHAHRHAHRHLRKGARIRPTAAALAATGLLGGLLVVAAPPAAAAELQVTTNEDNGAGSLRDALRQANASPADDRITFAPSVRGTITLTSGALSATVGDGSGDLVIEGPGADVLTVDGDLRNRVLDVTGTGDASTVVSALTLTRGSVGWGEDANQGIFEGGAVRSAGPDLRLVGVVVSASRAGRSGGGVHATGGTLEVVDSLVTGNRARSAEVYSEAYVPRGEGAGLWAETLTLTDSRVTGNEAHAGGGGLAAGSLVMTGSTVDHNVTDLGDGGGLLVGVADQGRVARITTSTIADNRARRGSGGGLAGRGDVVLNLALSTVTRNAAVAAGGVRVHTAALRESILHGNPGGDLTLDRLISRPRSIVGGADPLLGALGDHGGSTPTVMPAPGSRAIDAASRAETTTDQRGVERPVDDPSTTDAEGGDGSDVGAVELTTPELAGPSQVANLTAPVISGTVRVGETLSTDGGTWSEDVEKTYQWLRDGEPIAGADGATYAVTPDDFDRNDYGDDRRHRLSVVVTAEAPGLRDGVRESDLTDFVAIGRATMSRPPVVRGRLRVGSLLRAKPRAGAVSPTPSSVGVEWRVGRRLYTSGRTLRLRRGMRGERVRATFSYYFPSGYRTLERTVRVRGRVR